MQTTIGGFLFPPKSLTKEIKLKATQMLFPAFTWGRCKVWGMKLQNSVKPTSLEAVRLPHKMGPNDPTSSVSPERVPLVPISLPLPFNLFPGQLRDGISSSWKQSLEAVQQQNGDDADPECFLHCQELEQWVSEGKGDRERSTVIIPTSDCTRHGNKHCYGLGCYCVPVLTTTLHVRLKQSYLKWGKSIWWALWGGQKIL